MNPTPPIIPHDFPSIPWCVVPMARALSLALIPVAPLVLTMIPLEELITKLLKAVV